MQIVTKQRLAYLSLVLLFLSSVVASCTSTGELTQEKSSAPLEKLKGDIDKVLNDSIFIATQTGVKVISLKTGETLYERESRLLMHPASNTKLITTATALVELGTDFKFKTVMYADGRISSGILDGNLYVKGFGNPDFTSTDLSKMVEQVKARGITEIRGNILGDKSYFDSLYWGNGWMWDDEPSAFAAFISPLTINDNCVKVYVKPGKKVGDTVEVRIEPPTSYVSVLNQGTTVAPESAATLNVDRRWKERENKIVVKGQLPINSKEQEATLSVWNVEIYFLTLLKEELERQEIKVDGTLMLGTVPTTSVQVAHHEQPIDSVIINLNKISDNLSAENTLKTIAAERLSTPGSTRAGMWIVNRFLNSIGIDTTKYNVVDGSGVSHYSLVTPEMYVTLLKNMYSRDSTLFYPYYASLPSAGVDGTLNARMKDTKAEGNLRGKTGTINGVSTLSGYVNTANGEWLAFSIMMQNFIGSSKPYRDAQDKIGAILADFSRRAAPGAHGGGKQVK